MLYIFKNKKTKIVTAMLSMLSMLGVVFMLIMQIRDVSAAVDFEKVLEQFPESYHESLTAIHEAHPDWTFEAVSIEPDWNTVIKNESKLSRKLVPATGKLMSLGLMENNKWYSTPTAWKAYEEIDGAYNFEANDWVSFDTGKWSQASVDAISYVMDPRNWLTEEYIFMFEQLSFNESHDTAEIVNNTLRGSFMYDSVCPGAPDNMTYAQVIVEAAKDAKVSAVHLAVRLIQEKGINNDVLGKGVVSSDGKTYTAATGKEKVIYYNYFNIGASGSGQNQVINNGGIRAAKEKWTSPYLAIMGGALFIGSDYIKIGQDTLYFQQFSVVNKSYMYWKQYSQNLTATVTEGCKVYTTYKNAGLLESSYVFRIPVYKDIPDEACKRPASPSGDLKTTANPNNRLKEITVNDGTLPLTPSFSHDQYTYSVTVPYSTEKITLNATAIAETSKVSGTGEKSLKVGTNTYKITCTSQYGTSRTYNVSITREKSPILSTYLTSLTPDSGKFTTDFSKNTGKYTMTVNNSVSKLGFTYKMESSESLVELRFNDETTVCSDGVIPSCSLKVGKNLIYIDVYDKADKTGNMYTYEITVTRNGATSFDNKKLQINGSYINGFTIGEKISAVIKSVSVVNGKVQVLDSNKKVKSNDAIIATGDYITVYDTDGKVFKQYRAIVYGDIDGNGKIDAYDYVYIKKHHWVKPILTGIKLEAANVYAKTEAVDLYDMAIMKKYLWNNGKISQTR